MISFKALYDKIRASLSFEPTIDQSELIDKLSQFITSDSNNELFILRGYAGTGKTSVIGALTKSLSSVQFKSVLLAPTGRAAKVLSRYSGKRAFTIHRKIYKKYLEPEGGIRFGLAENKHKNTLFIVDEASMIGDQRSNEDFSGTSLMDDLMEYVYSGDNCKLIFSGDVAQLPPVGSPISPALNPAYLKNKYSFSIKGSELKTVVRQANESGVLFNATALRVQLYQSSKEFPQLTNFKDVVKVSGEFLEDALNEAYRDFGDENVLIITRSNKRANLFNQQIRVRIKFREESISAGDLMMAVKNNYTLLEENSPVGFIANGDGIELLKVIRQTEMYGLQFAEVVFRLPDYPEQPEVRGMLNLSTVTSENPNMTYQEQRALANLILQDLPANASRYDQVKYLRENEFYNALQVKFSYAVTCHKSQGGQWPCVFIDKGYMTQEMLGEEYYRWLYTAITRATEKVYLINFE